MSLYNEMLHSLNKTANDGWKNYKLGKWSEFKGGEDRLRKNVFPKGVIFSEYDSRELKKKEMEYLHRVSKCKLMSVTKGGEKVKPYLETKVVKVKKEKKINCEQPCNDEYYCFCCKYNFTPKQPEGNWVNGENLDKIKFPCFCSYKYFGKTRYAILSGGVEFGSPDRYNWSLIDIDKQNEPISELFLEYDLGKMISQHDIHILKGKITLFEEE